MKVTKLMMTVLRAIERNPDCGINYLDNYIYPDTRRHMTLRAGQYMGKLVRKGLVHKYYDEFRGKRGQPILCGVRYSLTDLAIEILNSER